MEIQQCMQFVGGFDTLLTVDYIHSSVGCIYTPVLGIHSSVGYIHARPSEIDVLTFEDG